MLLKNWKIVIIGVSPSMATMVNNKIECLEKNIYSMLTEYRSDQYFFF